MLTVAELIRYRLQNERYMHRVAEAQLPTAHGEFRMIAYESEAGSARRTGARASRTLRWFMAIWNVHSERVSQCWCASTHTAWREIYLARRCATAGRRLRGRCARLRRRDAVRLSICTTRSADWEWIAQCSLRGWSFHRSDGRAEAGSAARTDNSACCGSVGLGGQILSDLGIHRIILLSNHPTHVPALQGFGIEIVGQAPIPGVSNEASSSSRA